MALANTAFLDEEIHEKKGTGLPWGSGIGLGLGERRKIMLTDAVKRITPVNSGGSVSFANSLEQAGRQYLAANPDKFGVGLEHNAVLVALNTCVDVSLENAWLGRSGRSGTEAVETWGSRWFDPFWTQDLAEPPLPAEPTYSPREALAYANQMGLPTAFDL